MTYTNSSLVDYKILSPNNSGQRNHIIDTVTIHCMAGNLSARACGEWFAKSSAKASSNYGVDSSGRIGLYVEEKDRSWCSSNGANDNRAVTIEVANTMSREPYPVSDLAYDALIDLLVDICRRNGIPGLVWSWNKDDRVNHRDGCNMTVHRDFANKSCPGQWLYERQGQIAEAVNLRLAGAQCEKSAKAFATAKAYEVITKTDPLNVRHEPGSAGAILGTFARSEVVTGDSEATLADGSTWIRCTNGALTGWCSATYLREVAERAKEKVEGDDDMVSVEAFIAHMTAEHAAAIITLAMSKPDTANVVAAAIVDSLTPKQAACILDKAQEYYSKVSESEWIISTGELDEAFKLGITDAERPRDLITREEAAAMALRAYKLGKGEA